MLSCFTLFMAKDAVGAGIKPALCKNRLDALGNQAKMQPGCVSFRVNRLQKLELPPPHVAPCIKNIVWHIR